MHHAASALLAGRESIACGKKPSRRSAAFDAALAEHTTARLSSRNTASNQQQIIM